MTSEERSIIGTYRGYYTYSREKGAPPHQFEFEINSLDGSKFHGVGTDGTGDFVVTGTYEMDRLTFKKIYSKRSLVEVNYVGDFSIDGQKVTGHWWLPDGDGSWEARVIYLRKTRQEKPPPPKEVGAPHPEVHAPATPALPPELGVPAAPPANSVEAPISTSSTPEATKVAKGETETRCSNCGAARGDFNFCIQCGHAFDLS
jgi:hypothetical protein